MDSRHRHDIPIKAARIFVAIIQYGSFSAAAKALSIPQPTASVQIKRLEQIMGGRLFNNKAAGRGLTALGQLLEGHARRIVAVNDQAIALAGRRAYHETIYLGIQSVFSRRVLPDIVKLCREGTNVSYKYFGESAPDLTEKCKSGFLDLAFMVAPAEAALTSIAEWNEQLVWVRAPHVLPMKSGEPILFIGRNDGYIDREVFKVIHKHGISYRIDYNASELQTMISGVEAGLGLIVTPARCVPNTLEVAHEAFLPPLPQIRVGVFAKEEFDLVRHKAFVASFVSTVRPQDGRIVGLQKRPPPLVETVKTPASRDNFMNRNRS